MSENTQPAAQDKPQQLPAPVYNVPVHFNFFDPVHFETMQRVCQMFASSELVPEMYRIIPPTEDKPGSGNPKEKAIANCMIAVETANRIGASPLMVMQNMYIVYGQPSWSAKFLIATVNACGRYKSLKYRMTFLGKIKDVPFETTEWVNVNGKNKKQTVTKKFPDEVDNWECIAYTTEKNSDEVLESIPVTIEIAIKEGWYQKNGSKWRTMPKLMVQYRAATFWQRAYAPELSMGMRTDDEVRDTAEDIEYEDVSETVKKDISANANKEEIGIPEIKTDDKKEGSNGTEQPGEIKRMPDGTIGEPKAASKVVDKPSGAGF